MTHRQWKRKHIKDVEKIFSNYFNTLKQTCKDFGTENVPIALFDKLTPALKLESDSKEQVIIKLLSDHNNVIDSFIKTVHSLCDTMEATQISLTRIKELINLILDTYKKSME